MLLMLDVSEILSMQIGNTIQSNVSNVAHVEDIGEGIYTHPREKARLLMAFCLVGLVVRHQVV